MTTKTLTGTYAAAYTLAAPITTLSITSTGKLEAGVTAAAAGTYTVVNQGVVYDYLSLKGPSSVTNSGAIGTTIHSSGLYLAKGGSVTNTASGLISQIRALGSATIRNLGTVSGGEGVLIASGGLINNGSSTNTSAAIIGHTSGIVANAAATLFNYGSIYASVMAVQFSYGGTITNGSATDTSATINGPIYADKSAQIRNFATLTSSHYCVQISGGGTITNGSAADTSAVMDGGIVSEAAAHIQNFGTVIGKNLAGVLLTGASTLTNGSTSDLAAVCEGPRIGALVDGGIAKNYGTLGGTASRFGLVLYNGSATNGAANDITALIQGADVGFGDNKVGPATLTNFGTVEAVGTTAPVYFEAGAYFMGGGRVINGSTADTLALIEGPIGVYGENDPVTVSNYATISGTNYGVDLSAGGSISNLGVISSKGYAIKTAGPAVVSNGSPIENDALIKGTRPLPDHCDSAKFRNNSGY